MQNLKEGFIFQLWKALEKETFGKLWKRKPLESFGKGNLWKALEKETFGKALEKENLWKALEKDTFGNLRKRKPFESFGKKSLNFFSFKKSRQKVSASFWECLLAFMIKETCFQISHFLLSYFPLHAFRFHISCSQISHYMLSGFTLNTLDFSIWYKIIKIIIYLSKYTYIFKKHFC